MKTCLNKRSNTAVREKETPQVSFTDNTLECICSCNDEHNFAISTENGKIVEKGRFEERFQFDLKNLDPGYYQLTVFDAMYRDVFAFQVK